jgi:serine/threonine protein kinase
MQIDQIGKYHVQSKIGQGAMGEVYKGHDPLLNRDVAIKTLSASLVADEAMRARFMREAQAAAGLNHPNIITVYDFGQDHGKFYMAMELLEGRDLKDLIGHHAMGDLQRKLDVMEQIAGGLAFAHAHDVTHRDLKPANIHVQPTGQVKILDFGLARLSSSDMTRTGMVMGTPHYMSPEQVRGEKVDSRSDIFSLGALFYELLSGHKPFDGDSMHTVLFHVMQDDPEPLRKWVDVPPILVELVERMLVKDTARRLQTAALAEDALHAVRIVMAEGREDGATLESELGLPEATIVVDATGHAAAPVSTLDNRVVGAVALDSSREPAPGQEGMRRIPPTLSGRSSTQVNPAQRPFTQPPEGRSRWPLYAGLGAALLAVVVGAGVLFVNRSRPSAPAGAGADAGQEQISALTEALAANQVQLAKRRLEDKNYAGAVAQAERALKLDARSAEAKQVLETAQGALDGMRAAEAEARAQIQARNLDAASRALWNLMSADPNHAATLELTGALDKSFRGQAEEARRLTGQSRTAAEGAGAGRLEPFSEAAGQVKEGETLFGSGAYAHAAQKFLAARDGFERARRLAQR